MREGQRELDFVGDGVSVASPLQWCPHGCRVGSKSSPSYTEGIHGVLESSNNGRASITSSTSGSQMGDVG